jgi:hypothetical protein
MKKTVNKATHKAAFETAHIEYEGREYRIIPKGQGYIIIMDQGSGFRECGKFGLWDEAFVYRNLKLAQESLAIFESQCKKFKSI